MAFDRWRALLGRQGRVVVLLLLLAWKPLPATAAQSAAATHGRIGLELRSDTVFGMAGMKLKAAGKAQQGVAAASGGAGRDEAKAASHRGARDERTDVTEIGVTGASLLQSAAAAQSSEQRSREKSLEEVFQHRSSMLVGV
eukprot:TRINITY_DN36769_c0_g1_i4.p2 TRINITY_DN36769_c0_g1~~TRINITY_DN36769_c0_g1_i4.p2  ORF type:complete len:141 (+),score=46.63 TRINITY_DN36769_c0_g1_i4:585-1007(+)